MTGVRATAGVQPPITFVIVDYGLGNLRSVANALIFLGCEAVISDRPEDVRAADALVLPGVGAFGEAMRNLRGRGLIDALDEAVLDSGTPLLGICLGMQLIAERSDERGTHKGLGYLPGEVRQIPVPQGYRLPHVGWNTLTVAREQPLMTGLTPESSFYFVHTYHLECDDAYVAARCHYGVDVTAAVRKDRIFATQFHPEKSQTAGLRLLRNFVNYAEAITNGDGTKACSRRA